MDNTRRNFLLSLGAGGMATALAGGLVGCTKAMPSYHSIDIAGAQYCRDFHLNDVDGKLRSLADFHGKFVMMFFGFTQCPDICPTALARASAVLQKLGSDAHRLQVIFVTIDPERDTSELLRAYLQQFNPSFIGLRGDLAQTKQIADEFKVFYSKVNTGSSYTMDHSTLTYLFDPQGRVRLAMRHDNTADQYVADIHQLMQSKDIL